MASEWLTSAPQDDGAASRNKDSAPAGNVAGPQTETSPTQSPWWTAPAGRPVAIPAFGRVLRSWLDALLELLMPKPIPLPVKVRATRRR